MIRARDAKSRPQEDGHHHIQTARDRRCMMPAMLADPPELVNRSSSAVLGTLLAGALVTFARSSVAKQPLSKDDLPSSRTRSSRSCYTGRRRSPRPPSSTSEGTEKVAIIVEECKKAPNMRPGGTESQSRHGLCVPWTPTRSSPT